MVDIHSATAESGREKKKIEEETTRQKYNVPHLLRRTATKRWNSIKLSTNNFTKTIPKTMYFGATVCTRAQQLLRWATDWPQ